MKRYWCLLICACLGLALHSGGEEAPPAAPPEPETVALEQDDDARIMDIRTVDGRVFRNATVERVTPIGVDIGYLRKDGTYAMVGLPLSRLTPELQKEFGYDPEIAKKFEEKLRAAAAKSPEEVVESEAARLARITREVKERLSGADIRIKPADLRFAIYAHRRAVVVLPVERVLSGTVAAILEDSSDQPKLNPPLVLIDRLELPEGTGKWSGFLYPTGMHARYRELEKIPVYADSLDEAQVLLERYLDIYSEFAATQKDQSATDGSVGAPDQAAGTQTEAKNAYGVAGLDAKGGNVPGRGRAYDLGGQVVYYDYPYFIGNTYWPVVWWSSNCYRPWPQPRPPRPYPPKPGPRPPRPDPTPLPPDPGPGPRPPRPNPNPNPNPNPSPNPNPPGPRPPSPEPKPVPGYVERNGGFRRIVPTPAQQVTWPGTPVPSGPPRPAPTPRPGGFGGPPR